MGSPAHPHAMQPPSPGRTKTAPPMKPASWPSATNIRVYTAFGLTGIVYLLLGLLALRLVWALGSGPAAWQDALEGLSNPLYLAFHALCLVSLVFVAVRFFRLFPKAQPPRIGPAKPPPGPVIHAMLYVVWLGVTAIVSLVLAGGIL